MDESTLKSREIILQTLKNFDDTYQMSDDHSVWTKGTNLERKMTQMVGELSKEDLVWLWEEVKKLPMGYRSVESEIRFGKITRLVTWVKNSGRKSP